jgi:hypothetical protein
MVLSLQTTVVLSSLIVSVSRVLAAAVLLTQTFSPILSVVAAVEAAAVREETENVVVDLFRVQLAHQRRRK